MCPFLYKFGVVYVMVCGLVLIFIDGGWAMDIKRRWAIVVRGKVRKFLQDNWIWKTSCSVFLPFIAKCQKDTKQEGWVWRWISTCFDSWVCVIFLPISTWNWQDTLRSVLQKIHDLQHIFYLKYFWKFSHDYRKMLLEVPISWHQSLDPPPQPTVYERLLILSSK